MLVASSLWAQAPSATHASSADVATAGTSTIATARLQPANKANDGWFVIGNEDVLAVSVWKEPELSKSIPVRLDGRISLPLIGELQAAGLTPSQLEQDISTRLRKYIAEPEVTVIVQQINSQNFNILGQVVRPGSYSLASASTVLDAIAAAGGFRDFAKQKSVYVLRQHPDGPESRMTFNYKDFIKGKSPEQNIRLEPHDTVIVP